LWSVVARDVHLSSRQRRSSTSTSTPFDVMAYCIDDVSRWFLENEMLFILSKTETVLFGTRAQRKQFDTSTGTDVIRRKDAFISTTCSQAAWRYARQRYVS